MTYDDYETTNSTDKWTQEFGEVKDIKAYHSIHYKNERPFIDPLVPRRFFLNGTLYIEAKERKMAWDEPLFEVIYLIVIEEIAQMMQTETLDSALVENFCLVIIPIWITWFNIERLNNLFGAENTTFKFFSWIYYVCVVTMAVNALNVFAEDPEQCTIIPYLGAYFLSQGLCLFYSLSLYYTVPKLAGPRLWVSSLNIICGLPAIMPLFYPIPVKAAWWTAWTLQFLSFKVCVFLCIPSCPHDIATLRSLSFSNTTSFHPPMGSL